MDLKKKIVLSANKCHQRKFASLLAPTIGDDSYQVTRVVVIFRYLGEKKKTNRTKLKPATKEKAKHKTSLGLAELLSSGGCRTKQRHQQNHGVISNTAGGTWPDLCSPRHRGTSVLVFT